MAVEEVFLLFLILLLLDATIMQEFAIEIPDAEADEIQTVQQGLFPTQVICALTYVRA